MLRIPQLSNYNKSTGRYELQLAVARFFDTTCQGIFNHLLQVKSSDGGLFGPLSTYFGTVETNGRVNPFNPALMSITRSNHNVNCIPSNVKALALVGYITNYATKGDCSQYQRVMGAAFVQKSWEKKAAAIASHGVLSPAENSDQKFSLKAYNRLAYDKEISGPSNKKEE